MNFINCLEECIKNKTLISEFNRLTDFKLGIDSRSPIEIVIDDATGYDEQKEYMRKFIDFVYMHIWLPLVASQPANTLDTNHAGD